jgi:hypothetical protein
MDSHECAARMAGMSTESSASVCIVCLEVTEAHTEAFCNACGGVYHLNQRSDLPGKDCGEVWINEEFQALEFACNTCLHPEEAAGGLDEIIDLDEAATVSSLSQETLLLAAEQGTLRSKRLSGGVVVFERRDVVEFAARRP